MSGQAGKQGEDPKAVKRLKPIKGTSEQNN